MQTANTTTIHTGVSVLGMDDMAAIERTAARMYHELVENVYQRLNAVSHLEAIDAIRACLTTLSDCLCSSDAEGLANHLPGTLGDCLRRPIWKPGERLTEEDFISRVARREAVTEQTARNQVPCVFAALRSICAIPDEIIERTSPQLPVDIASAWTGTALESAHMHQPLS